MIKWEDTLKARRAIIFLIALCGIGFPCACVGWLIDRYLVAYNLPEEDRMLNSWWKFIPYAAAWSMMGWFCYLLVKCLPPAPHLLP